MNKRFKVSCFDPKSGSTRDLMLVAADEAAVMSLVQQAGLLAMGIELLDVPGPEASAPPAPVQPVAAPVAVSDPPAPSPVAPVVVAPRVEEPVAPPVVVPVVAPVPPLVVAPVVKAPKPPSAPVAAHAPVVVAPPVIPVAAPVVPAPVMPVAVPAPVVAPMATPILAPMAKAPKVAPAASVPTAIPTAVPVAVPVPVSTATSRSSTPALAPSPPMGTPVDYSSSSPPGTGKRRRHNENTFPPEGEVVINVVPMLDMTFQLLFFFIITFQSPSGVEAQIPLSLPPPEGQQEASKDKKDKTDKDIIPTIDSDVTVEVKSLNNPQYPGEMGEVEVSGLAKEVIRPTPGKSLDEGRAEVLARLGDAMKQMAQDLKKDNLSLRLKADPGVKWERVIQVADTCRQAKFLGIRFEKPGGS